MPEHEKVLNSIMLGNIFDSTGLTNTSGFHSHFDSEFQIFFNAITFSGDRLSRHIANVNPYTSTAIALKVDPHLRKGLFIIVQDTEDTGLRNTIYRSIHNLILHHDEDRLLSLFLDIQHQICKQAAVVPSRFRFRGLRQMFSTGALQPLQELNTLLDSYQALIQSLRSNQNVMASLKEFFLHYGHMLSSDHARSKSNLVGSEYLYRLTELTNNLQAELYTAEANQNHVSSVANNAGWPQVLTKEYRFSIRSRTSTI